MIDNKKCGKIFNIINPVLFGIKLIIVEAFICIKSCQESECKNWSCMNFSKYRLGDKNLEGLFHRKIESSFFHIMPEILAKLFN